MGYSSRAAGQSGGQRTRRPTRLSERQMSIGTARGPGLRQAPSSTRLSLEALSETNVSGDDSGSAPPSTGVSAAVEARWRGPSAEGRLISGDGHAEKTHNA